MRYLIVLTSFLSLPFHATFAQYSLDIGIEVALFGTAASLTATEYLFFNDFTPLSDEEIQNFYTTTPNTFTFKFDQWATKQSSKTARTISDVFLRTSVIPPLLLIFDRPNANDDRKTQTIMALETFALTASLTNLSKKVVRRPRPFMYNDDLFKFPLEMRRTKNARMSFFSGHTSLTTAMYFFTATTFSEYYPNSPWKPWVWTSSISIPALTGFLRVKAGKHFPTDILVGYMVGALIGGVLVPALH